MRPSSALGLHREAIRRRIEHSPTTNVRVFGSVLLGNDRKGSDLDLLVDLQPGATLFDLGDLQLDLEEMLCVPVDLLTPGDLPERFRQQVLAVAGSL